jgi:hypothetical protein
MTRSGRIFSSDQAGKNTAGLMVEPVKGKMLKRLELG